MKIRCLTLGLSLLYDDFYGDVLQCRILEAATILEKIEKDFIKEGYDVQTKRISLNSFEEWMIVDGSYNLDQVKQLVRALGEFDIKFCSLGNCQTKAGIKMIPDILSLSPKLCASVSFRKESSLEFNFQNCKLAAEACLKIAVNSPQGPLGNFGFCASFNCPAGIPFFPASFHNTDESDRNSCNLSIGLECGDLLFLSFHAVEDMSVACNNLQDVLRQALLPVQRIVISSCESLSNSITKNQISKIVYNGIDASMVGSLHAIALFLYKQSSATSQLYAIKLDYLTQTNTI